MVDVAQEETMAAKVHKSLRLEKDLLERVEVLKLDGESVSNALCRVLSVGCDTLEGAAQTSTYEHGANTQKSTDDTDVYAAKLIDLLEKENERLVEQHADDLRRIEEKDGQIAAALTKAHDLAEQSHVLAGRAQEAGQLPPAAHDEGGEVMSVSTIPKKITFREWWKIYR